MINLKQQTLPDKTQYSERQISKIPAEFELAIPARQGAQTHALDRAISGIEDLQLPIIIRLGGNQSWYGKFRRREKSLIAAGYKISVYALCSVVLQFAGSTSPVCLNTELK
jgi:hypothetical protein